MRRREFLGSVGLAALGTAVPASTAFSRPNVLFILAEDLGPQLGCYGEPLARTPNLDRLAAQGTRFDNAFVTAPVCSPSRSSLMTGMYATSIGAHNHRTWKRGKLPVGVRPLTEHLRAAGYFNANVGGDKAATPGRPPLGSDKTDLNFAVDRLFDGRAWSERRPGQPFFAQLTLMETHRSSGWGAATQQVTKTDPAKVAIPPYYPDHPVVRADLARYHDAVARMDEAVGRALRRLAADGLADDTIVVFIGDNGQSLVRGKQFLYDGGLRVPLIIRRPGARGSVDERLVTGNDLAPTILGFARVARPAPMHGQDLFSPDYREPDHVVATRDRCDVAVDRMRCVRTRRYKYIRNYMPAVPYMQINPYMERHYPVWNLLRELKAAGTLGPVQALFAADRKPVEELYDLPNDPHEVRNLALDPGHRAILRDMRARLDGWVGRYGDDGRLLEDPLAVVDGYFGSLDPAAVEAGKRDAALRVMGGAGGIR